MPASSMGMNGTGGGAVRAAEALTVVSLFHEATTTFLPSFLSSLTSPFSF
jgi:hypothetical protein